jgi:hypothetical protein
MRFKLAIHFTAVCLLGVASAVIAQQPGQQGQGQQGRGGRGFPGGPPGGFGGGMFGGGGASRMGLLRIAEVRKELELADEQVAEIEKVNEELRAKYPSPFGGRGGPGGTPGGDGQRGRRGGTNNNEGASLAVPAQWYFVVAQDPQQGQGQKGGRGFGNFQPPTPEQLAEMEKQRLERSREENAKLAEILLPNQLKRLNEIYIQQAGTQALQDEDVAKTLGISDAQKDQITKVREANREAMRSQGQEAFAGLDGEARAAKFAEMRKANDDKVLAVLTAAQRTKFEEMKGKPFTMPEGGFGRGGGGPGGTRGRGGNRGTNN